MEVTPSLVLAMWTGGMAGAAAVVAWWRIVGPGFSWLAGTVVALFGLGVAVFDDEVTGYVGVVLALGAAIMARRPPVAAAFFAGAALALFLVAIAEWPVVPAVTGTVFLGGITTEMMLGHWYLVDPRLPRWALQRLDVAAGAGLIADFVYAVLAGALDWVPSDAVLGWAYIGLALMTFLLVIAVWYSLLEPEYSGVMAATGLSYLAVLTAFGVTVLGRLLVFE
jgi:hypothetical protein